MLTAQLLDYIEKARAQNIPDEQIASNLMKIGWKEPDVTKALTNNSLFLQPATYLPDETLMKSGNPPPATFFSSVPPFLKIFWLILVTLILLSILLSLIGFGVMKFLIKSPSLEVFDQSVKNSITVKKATLLKNGWIAIKTSYYGLPNNMIGMSTYLNADTYTDFEVPFYNVEALSDSKPKPGIAYFLIIYEDVNKDKLFDEQKDQIARDFQNQKIQKKITFR